MRVQVTLKKPRFWEGEVVEILKSSRFRRKAPCPVAGPCGGCSWQHVTYEGQLFQKQKILEDSLRQLSKVSEWEWLPLLPAAEEFHYRNRIQIQVRNGKPGFFSKRSHDLVPIERCLIAEEPINVKLKEVSGAAVSRRFEIAVNENGEVLVMPEERDPEAALFSQVNRAQNQILKTRVAGLISGNPDWIFDLYSGAGNLTFPIAERFPEAAILSVDLSRAAIQRGEAAGAAFPKIQWLAGDVGRVLKKQTPQSGHGLIVLDPPRMGCTHEVLAQVLRHKPKQIIYVSCNPTTFARDALKLVEAFKLERVQGLDMFPQTEHVELISSFQLS